MARMRNLLLTFAKTYDNNRFVNKQTKTNDNNWEIGSELFD